MINWLLALTKNLTVFKARFVFFASFTFLRGKVFTVAPSDGFFLCNENTVTRDLLNENFFRFLIWKVVLINNSSIAILYFSCFLLFFFKKFQMIQIIDLNCTIFQMKFVTNWKRLNVCQFVVKNVWRYSNKIDCSSCIAWHTFIYTAVTSRIKASK